MNFGKVLIFGDSYSTYSGYIPEGNAAYYPTSVEGRPKLGGVEDTWWYSLIKETGSELVLNDSWSGSTIGYRGYSGSDTSTTSSFIKRLRKMKENGFFTANKIDTVFIFGATNDNWADAPIGKTKYKNIRESDLYEVLPAICYFLENVKELLPAARVIFIINSELKYEIVTGIKRASKHYSVESVLLSDIDKQSGHPTALGMARIKDIIIKKLT